jgi:hypothetical protein
MTIVLTIILALFLNLPAESAESQSTQLSDTQLLDLWWHGTNNSDDWIKAYSQLERKLGTVEFRPDLGIQFVGISKQDIPNRVTEWNNYLEKEAAGRRAHPIGLIWPHSGQAQKVYASANADSVTRPCGPSCYLRFDFRFKDGVIAEIKESAVVSHSSHTIEPWISARDLLWRRVVGLTAALSANNCNPREAIKLHRQRAAIFHKLGEDDQAFKDLFAAYTWDKEKRATSKVSGKKGPRGK